MDPLESQSNIPQGLDPTAFYLTKSIKQAETGEQKDPYNTKGASGEFGAYQFTNNFWTENAAKYLGSADAEKTPENQNKLAYSVVNDLLRQGYKKSEVASFWNSGRRNPYELGGGTGKGKNSLGVEYDVPGYVNRVKNIYTSYYGGTPGQVSDTGQPTEVVEEKPISTGVDFTELANKEDVTGGLKLAQSVTPFGKIAEKVGGLLAKKANKKDINDALNTLASSQMELIGKIQTYEDEGKDPEELKQSLKQIQNTISSLTENADKLVAGDIKAKELIGSAVSGLGMIAGGAALKGASLLTKVLSGAASGYAIDVGTNLEQDKEVEGKDFIPGFGTAISTALPFAGALIGKLVKTVGGFTAKTGEEVIDMAMKHPDDIAEAVSKYSKSPEKKKELITLADNSFTQFKKNMVDDFGKSLKSLTANKPISGKEIATQAFNESMGGFGISLKQSAKKPGVMVPDLSKSKLNKSERDEVKWIWDQIKNFRGDSLEEVQNLKELVSNTNNKFLKDVAGKMVKSINESYPGYKQMLDKYTEGIKLMNSMKSEISSVGRATDTTKLNRILKIFKKDAVVRKNLEKLMGKANAEKFLKEISGAILSNWITAGSNSESLLPLLSGVLGYMTGGIPGGAIGAAGATAVKKAAQSPRIVGKAARVLGGETSNTSSLLNIPKIVAERKAAEQNKIIPPGSQSKQ